MGSSLVAKMETRLIRGKPVMVHMVHEEEHGSIGYEEDAKEDALGMPQKAQQQTGVELFMQRSYSIPERPDVKINRTVWAYREKR